MGQEGDQGSCGLTLHCAHGGMSGVSGKESASWVRELRYVCLSIQCSPGGLSRVACSPALHRQPGGTSSCLALVLWGEMSQQWDQSMKHTGLARAPAWFQLSLGLCHLWLPHLLGQGQPFPTFHAPPSPHLKSWGWQLYHAHPHRNILKIEVVEHEPGAAASVNAAWGSIQASHEGHRLSRVPSQGLPACEGSVLQHCCTTLGNAAALAPSHRHQAWGWRAAPGQIPGWPAPAAGSGQARVSSAGIQGQRKQAEHN